MPIKIIAAILLITVCYNLARGLYFLLTDSSGSNRTVKSLTWRVIFSVGVFCFLLIAYAFGLIQPHHFG